MGNAVHTAFVTLIMLSIMQSVSDIELKDEKSEEERLHVKTMFQLFATQWMLATWMNIITVFDPTFDTTLWRGLRDASIGMLLAVMAVTFVYFGQGLFIVEVQEESGYLRSIAIILNVMGFF